MSGDFEQRATEVLAAPVMALLGAAGEVADEVELELFLVGGAVRDILLGRATEDIDLVVLGSATSLVDRLAAALEAAVESESRFRTWRLALPDGRRLDLAEARSETYLTPGALPTISPGALASDLGRRDFAVNAMAVRLGREQGALIDPYSGSLDLAERRLRILHPASFDDDPTRILRGLELAQRLDFEFDQAALAAARRTLAVSGLGTISPARFRTAWRRCFGRLIERGEAAVLAGLESASSLGLLAALSSGEPGAELSPQLRLVVGRLAQTEETDPGAEHGVKGSRLLIRALAGEDAVAARHLAMLWSSRPEAATSWQAFGPKARALRQAAEEGLALPSQVASALAAFDEEELELLALLAQGGIDRLLSLFRRRVLTTRLAVSGRDLLALGYGPGPEVGAALAATLQARLDGLITAGEELEYACRRLSPPAE